MHTFGNFPCVLVSYISPFLQFMLPGNYTSNQYVAMVRGLDPCILGQLSPLITKYVSSNSYENYTSYHKHFFKHRMPFNVIFGNYEHIVNLLTQFEPISYTPYTLYFVISYISSSEKSKSKSAKEARIFYEKGYYESRQLSWRQPQPATKIILEVEKQNLETYKVTPYLTCLKYCNLKNFPQGSITTNPLQLHRLLFRKTTSPRAIMKALVYQTFTDYFQRFPWEHRGLACYQAVGKNKFMMYCGYEIMATIYLAQLHNFTLHILNVADPREVRSVKFFVQTVMYTLNGQAASQTMYSGPHWNKPLSGYILSKHNWEHLLYCKRGDTRKTKKFTIDPLVWTTPFDIDIWIAVSLLIVTGALAFAVDFRKSLWDIAMVTVWIRKGIFMVGVFCGDSCEPIECRRRLLYLWILYCVFFSDSLYENIITSLAIAPDKPQVYQTIKQLLDNDYKILWFDSENNFNGTVKLLEYKFREMGYFHQIRESFKLYPPGQPLPNYSLLANLDGKNKYAKIVPATILHFMQHSNQKEVVQQTKDFRALCHYIPEPLMPGLRFWDVTAINRHWIKETMQIFLESGLAAKWDAWVEWAAQNNNRDQIDRKLLIVDNFSLDSMDTIVFQKFLAILILWGILIVATCVVFALERILNSSWEGISIYLKKGCTLGLLKFYSFRKNQH